MVVGCKDHRIHRHLPQCLDHCQYSSAWPSPNRADGWDDVEDSQTDHVVPVMEDPASRIQAGETVAAYSGMD
jgi:hypothetical protein